MNQVKHKLQIVNHLFNNFNINILYNFIDINIRNYCCRNSEISIHQGVNDVTIFRNYVTPEGTAGYTFVQEINNRKA